ncbi:MAG: sbcC [Gemmataceae bacterium]|nr:sbcC [Gemmataceae bacterium]
MIPQRVKLSGFLSYKDEQEIRFDGSQLWMLSGTNGSGKSSIFDAVTYSLFGHHRGGSQSATELINKESNTLAVEFDFTIEKTLYRVKRTVRRRPSGVASTQQLLKYVPNDITGGEWEPVPDTQLRARFDAWVKDKIGLDYETFTSSVLLLQGKSEKLLDSTPAGRAGVLARIVDLERYQKLHARADEKRRELKGALEGIANQLAGLREVTDDELAAAVGRIDAAEVSRTQTQERIDQLNALELQARRWAEAQTRLAATRQKLTTAESLLGHAVAIEKDHARLRELRDVLPAVGTIVTERGRIGESDRKTDRLTKDRETRADLRRQIEHALDQARKKLVALKKTLAEDEARQGQLNTRLRELSGVLEKVRQVEEAEAEARRLEDDLNQLPADPEARVRKLQDEQERLVVLGQVWPMLDRLVAERSELLQAAHREETAKKDEAKLMADGKRAKGEFEKVQADLAGARQAREQADQSAAEARALAHQAKQLADEFRQLTGAKTCRACGQALTPEHFDAEKKKRDLDAKVAERKFHDLTKAAADARDKEDALARKEADARKHLDELRDRYKEKAADVKQAGAEITRLVASCRQTYLGLPEPYKEKVSPDVPADWAAVGYPARDELAALRREAANIDAVKRQLRDAQDTTTRAQALRAKLDSARDRLTKVRQALPSADAAALRQEYAAKQTEETSVGSQIKATKKEIGQTETEVDRQQRGLGEMDRDLVELAGKLNLEESTRKHGQEAIERAKRTLPPAWQKPIESAGLTERAKWQDEFDALTTKGTEAKFTQLQAARSGLDSLRAEIAGLEQEADAFPEEARRSPDEVRGQVSAARKDLDACNRELLDAQRQKGSLDDFRRQRADLGDRYKLADAEHNRYKMLAELLGRDRLQRHLVRRAERQIVDYGNSVLDRLSGGQLFLKLVGTEDGSSTDKALDLECYNRVTGGAPINVAFLSGSQRFRVAVALALGIGQYASKQHRPIESVIIDEGFGCLDRAGRQVMIQELQNLRGHLHCILLVSHQEEFADAFPDGYRFELTDGATRVSRFVR